MQRIISQTVHILLHVAPVEELLGIKVSKHEENGVDLLGRCVKWDMGMGGQKSQEVKLNNHVYTNNM